MDDCCTISSHGVGHQQCPICHGLGKSVKGITLKALPSALERIQPGDSYFFCPNPQCEVVYFSEAQHFNKTEVKVPVFPKDRGPEVPVCYCFGWTRNRLAHAILKQEQPIASIHDHVQENRCGCEVNNPQGTCCLGNVTDFIRQLKQEDERT